MGTNSMHVAKTGLNAQNRRMQVIANNLANVNTTGFKRERVNFETLLYQVLRSSGEQTSADTNLTSAFSVGTGVRVVNADKLFSQGSIVSTDNALDLAVDGAGFFQVLLPDGRIGYTRNGTFSRNNEGALTTSSGYVIQPEVVLPEDAQEINVSSDGVVSVQLPGAVEQEEVGQLELAEFQNRNGLQPIGESFYVETTASGEPIVANPLEGSFGKLVQGALESSNVSVVKELVDMIETQRAYEVNSKAISSVDEMMRFISNNL
jgi:flagellar basal-body rod protein FlgG